MAIYHFSAQVIGRNQGRSSVAAAAYRSGTELTDERTGLTHDYTRKQGVSDSFIMKPENAPDWMADRQSLWNAVEAIEKRKDSQLARDIEMSLPHELSDQERRAVLVGFLEEQFISRGYVADVNIHAPHRHGDQKNHHAHVMLSTREILEEGFGGKMQKASDWNDRKDDLSVWREKWADHVNRALEEKELELGYDLGRIDHRSNEDRGLDQAPTKHEGVAATAMKRRGEHSDIVEENKKIKRDNIKLEEMNRIEEMMDIQLNQKTGRIVRNEEHLRARLQDRNLSDRADMEILHKRQNNDLDIKIEDAYGETYRDMKAKAEALQDKLDQSGGKGLLRTVSGLNLLDKRKLEGVNKTIDNIEMRMGEMRSGLANEQKLDAYHLEEKQRSSWDNLDDFIERGQSFDNQRSYEIGKQRQAEWEAQKAERDQEYDNPWDRDRDRERTYDEPSPTLDPKPPTIH